MHNRSHARHPGVPAGLTAAALLTLLTHPSTAAGETAHRTLPLPRPQPFRVGFTPMPAAKTGVTFTNTLTADAGAANRVLENGSGVALGDVDLDGWPDIFLCGISGGSALYRNLGQWRFVPATAEAGLTSLQEESCRGAVFADINGDRQPDLLVSTHARGVRVFTNSGQGRLQETTREAGLGPPRPGTTTLALADVDGDGTLDLYVTRYRAEDIRDHANVEARVIDGLTVLHPKYEGRLFLSPRGLLEHGESDVLYLNDGQGRFRECSWTDGRFLDENGQPLSNPPRDWGLSASFRDFTGDGLPDLYVCNDYWTADRIWINQGTGIFRAAPPEAFRHTPENSMGVDFGDFDRDGHVDLLVVDMLTRDLQIRRRQALAQSMNSTPPGQILDRPQFMRNALFWNRGDGSFIDIADHAGLAASDWSWQPLILDVDLDGLEDVVIPTGHRRDLQDLDATERVRRLQHPWPANMDPAVRQRAFTRELQEHARLHPPLPGAVVAFRNSGNLRFEDTTRAWGLDTPAVHQGIAAADLDRDGDLDLVINKLDDVASLLRNDAVAGRLLVKLQGRAPNTDAIGATVTLHGGAVPGQSREMIAGGRYLSGSEPALVFATGAAAGSMELEVRWRDGRTTRVPGIRSDHVILIDEASSEPTPATPSSPKRPLFTDATERLQQRHDEPTPPSPMPAMAWPRGLGRRGPAMAWSDLDGDGREDLVVGDLGNGGPVDLCLNRTSNGVPAFLRVRRPVPDGVLSSGLIVVPGAAGPRIVLGMGSATGTHRAALPVELPLQTQGRALQDLQPTPAPVAVLALADLEGDGDLDLFVGAHASPGRYPEAEPSRILVRDGARWDAHPSVSAPLAPAGLVNAAAWGDLDADGQPDLVLACEWGPIRVFRNRSGQLSEVTRAWGLAPLTGWWSGVALGDFNGDGRLDIVASNWGLNTGYRATADQPLILYHGDFLQRGVVDVLGSEWDPVRQVLIPALGLQPLGEAMPTLRQHFPTHAGFAAATTEQVLKALGQPYRSLEVRTLASTVFLNRGNGFEARELPYEAQLAPAFGTSVADFDGDGADDLFLAQNFFDLPASLPRADAGRGLLLRGRGDGSFEPLSAATSGIRVHGEQRASAVADFDQDGRPDLAVAQNGAATRLFRNQGGREGLRVHLSGPQGNPRGIGATLQLLGDRHSGPARLVTAGGGFHSQDSPVRVLSAGFLPTRLRIHWPHREPVEHILPPGARDVRIDQDGLQVLR